MPLGTRIGTRKLAASTLNCPRRYVSLCLFREATQLKTDSTIVHIPGSKPRYIEMQSHAISVGRQSRPVVSAEADAAQGTRMAAEVARGGATAVGQRSGIRFFCSAGGGVSWKCKKNRMCSKIVWKFDFLCTFVMSGAHPGDNRKNENNDFGTSMVVAHDS